MSGNALYIVGTLLQVVAYVGYRVHVSVLCWAGVAYWLALLMASKWGHLR